MRAKIPARWFLVALGLISVLAMAWFDRDVFQSFRAMKQAHSIPSSSPRPLAENALEP